MDIFIPRQGGGGKSAEKGLLAHLSTLAPDTKLMFKLSIPSIDDFYAELIDDPHVVRVVALSGGYSQVEANQRLARESPADRKLFQGAYRRAFEAADGRGNSMRC